MRLFRRYWLGLVLLGAQLPLPAQVGYPPGQYPGGGYPGTGGVGLPFPRRNKKKKDEVQLQSFDGMLRRIEKEQVVLEDDDTRILNFKRTNTTKFMKDGVEIKTSILHPGDHVTVEASQDDEGFLTAANILWQQDGTAAERQHAAEPVETSVAKSSAEDERPRQHRADAPANTADDAKTPAAAAPTAPSTAPAGKAEPANDDSEIADLKAPAKVDVPATQIDPDDSGPPVLKRGGKAVAHKNAAPAPAQSSEPDQTARNEAPDADSNRASPAYQPPATDVQRPEEILIEKARQESGNFLEGLPNYVCQEFMTRYQSSGSSGWQPIDVVSTALVYENGRESYRDVAVNGKLTKKNIEDLPGSWSTGEFGTVLADVFSPATAADFEYRRESRSGGRAAMMYDFTVEREHSHWKIMVASQLVQPPYKGSVWIDKETHRVLRIEMQATHVPEAFPADKVESATDYEYVRFGGEHQFLVPVHAETLSCERGTDRCSRNAIDFRNYHKYSGEATIVFK